MAKRQKPDHPDKVILGVLVYEFRSTSHADSHTKIKYRLRYYKLGQYDQTRVDQLRRFKDALQDEIHKHGRSDYYIKLHGKYADMKDFDLARLAEDFSQAFPNVSRELIEWFLPWAVFAYYLK